MPSIFTRIIKGEIPCYKIHETDHILSFLSQDAIAPGHTLVIPKIEADHFSDVPEPYYSAVYEAAKPISKAIHKATGCVRVAQAVIGLEVPHFHLHLVPINIASDLDFKKARRLSDEDNRALVQKIQTALKDILKEFA